MLKLKDIFTLDLNTRGGGVKLFNKIANKYNLHKEDRKDLMNVEVGSSNNSNFEYWYLKTTSFETPNKLEINIPTYFRRGVGEIIQYSSPVLRKCLAWPIANTGCWMYAIEVLKLKYDTEYVGVIFNIDATSYDNWIHSISKSFVNIIPEEQFEESMNLMKETFVEISKEEFEEIYNNAQDIPGL